MRTIIFALVTFSLSACGVDSPANPRAALRINAMQTATDGTTPNPGPQVDAEPCDFTIDCAVGQCDLVTHTCFGDDDLTRPPHDDERQPR